MYLKNYADDFNHITSLNGLTVLKPLKELYRFSGSAKYQVDKDFIVQEKPPKKKLTQVKTKTKPSTTKKNYTINKKQVRQRILLYHYANTTQPKSYFWTITFPKTFPDLLAHKAFNIWLTRLRKEIGLSKYIWVSERQKNGTIHFHTIINQYLNVIKANSWMRASITNYIVTERLPIDLNTVREYNGVDIAKDRTTKRVINFGKKSKLNQLKKYLTKYITKNNSTFENLAWHCSRHYSNLFTTIRTTFNESIDWNIYSYVNTLNRFETQYFTHYFWEKEPPPNLISTLTDLNKIVLSKTK